MKSTVIRPLALVNRIIRVHTFGINDTELNKTIRKLIHLHANNIKYHEQFPYVYLFKACHTSKKLINAFLSAVTTNISNEEILSNKSSSNLLDNPNNLNHQLQQNKQQEES